MKLCVQTGDVVDDLGLEAGYRLLRECGFEAIDWNIDHGWDRNAINRGDFSGSSVFELPEDQVLAHYAEELAIIRKNGLVISQAHAPFPSYSTKFPQLLEYAIGIHKACIRLCDAVGCKNLVIHGISMSPAEPELTPEKIDELNMHLYTSLIPTLKGTCVTVCLENLFATVGGMRYEGTCSNPYEAVRYIDTLNELAGEKHFGLCMDVGHLNLLRKNITHYVRTLGKRICCLHVHDNNGIEDQHLMPFVGTVRWNDLLAALKEIGYDGDFSFETFAQVKGTRMDAEFIPAFLRCIADTGCIFIKRITE